MAIDPVERWSVQPLQCNRRGFNIPRPGGTVSSAMRDETLQHNDYVHLSFHWDQPMKYVRQQRQELGPCAILGINPVVMLWRNTKFSDKNASDNLAQIGDDASALEKISLKVAKLGYSRLKWKTETAKKQVQAEVLVLKHVPLSLITVYCIESCITEAIESADKIIRKHPLSINCDGHQTHLLPDIRGAATHACDFH